MAKHHRDPPETPSSLTPTRKSARTSIRASPALTRDLPLSTSATSTGSPPDAQDTAPTAATSTRHGQDMDTTTPGTDELSTEDTRESPASLGPITITVPDDSADEGWRAPIPLLLGSGETSPHEPAPTPRLSPAHLEPTATLLDNDAEPSDRVDDSAALWTRQLAPLTSPEAPHAPTRTISDAYQHENENPILKAIRVTTRLIHFWPETPSIPFPVQELPDPSSSNSLPYGTHRWRFHGEPPAKQEEFGRASLLLLEQLRQHRPDHLHTGTVLISFPPTNDKRRYAEVACSNPAAYHYARSAKLTWRNRPMELAGSAAPLNTNDIVLKLNFLRSNTDLSSFLDSAHHQLGATLHLTDAWAGYNIHTYNDAASSSLSDGTTISLPPNTFNGTILLLGQLRPHRSADDLPGWFRYEDTDHTLHFKGRGDRCSFCKNTSRPVHTFAACRWKRCPHCGDRGHTSDSCPAVTPASGSGTRRNEIHLKF